VTGAPARIPLGFCSISALDRSLAEAARVAAGVGVDGIEVTERAPHLAPGAAPEEARAAGEAVRGHGLAVLAYGSYLGRSGPRTPVEAARQVALTRALGAPLLRVWAEPVAGAPDAGFAETVRLLKATCDRAEEAGIDVVVERHIGSFADTPERVERLLDAVGHPRLALNYQVLDLLPMVEADAQPEDAKRLAPCARYVHLKNYRAPEDGGDRMLPGGALARGVLDYGPLLRAILAAGYRGPMTIEFLSHEPRPLEEKLAEDVAFVRARLRELGRP
jgi:sugar phosphate isomerase/epimerase